VFCKTLNLFDCQLVETDMMWIPVMRTKPEEMQEVLIFDDAFGISVGYYFEATNCFIGSVDGIRLKHASFWMPLPDSPLVEQ
jgi:hypothetical protein